MIEFFVPGTPQPGGSKRAFFNPKTKRAQVVEACKGNPAWRSDVKAFALAAYDGPLIGGPLYLVVEFVMARPKGHFGSGKNAQVLKPSAPPYPTSKPDTTKLLRTLEDALTGIVWVDDAQVVRQEVFKLYADGRRIGAYVRVGRMGRGE